MEKSETPRTDALLLEINEGRTYENYGPKADLCRSLERETIALSAQVRELNEQGLKRTKELCTVTAAYEIMTDQVRELREKNEILDETLHQIRAWANAYPLSVFPEPNLVKVRALLEAGGITLDAVSASMMRHVLKGVEAMLKTAENVTKPDENTNK